MYVINHLFRFGVIPLSLYNYYFLTAMSSYTIIEFIYRMNMNYEAYIKENGVDPGMPVTMLIGLTVIPILTIFLTYITVLKMRRFSLLVNIMVFIVNLILSLYIYSIL